MHTSRVLAQERNAPKNLIENRIGFAGGNCELSIYDTYQSCKDVGLSSDEVLLCAMLSGKKVVHTHNTSIDFLPAQSLVMSPAQHINIDFPDATLTAPTSCLTIAISANKIKSLSDQLNIHNQLTRDLGEITYRSDDFLHTQLTPPTQSLLQRLTALYTENFPDRDALIDLGISELVVRMLHQQSRNFLLKQVKSNPEKSGIHRAIDFMNSNLGGEIDLEEVSKHACMSRSKFYEQFKLHLGCTPSEYLIQKRLETAERHIMSGMNITRACFESGFKSLSHFSRRFTQTYGKSPKKLSQDYQRRLIN